MTQLRHWTHRIAAAICGLALLSTAASAQCTPTATTNGPDVIVGDLNGIANYASDGTYEALAVGTTSCNIGNVWLNWIASTNQHPVIGQTLYQWRSVNGTYRFQQLGQGWLKHGFYALSEGLCCTGCQSTDGSHLGVRCSDPYTASRNGSQGGLGPKWQVNAHTGAFSYPPANPGFSGSVARRVQIPIADLVASSTTVKYAATGQYVTPDDAAAGNQNNNESWEQATVTGSGTAWTFGLTGATNRGQYALKAWQAFEPGVTLTEVQVPNDGLLIVGSEVYDLGGGLYRYEYAVQNLNGDRCVQAVSVPCGAGLNVTNIGFHDVNYHSGDGPGNVNFSGTDWTGTYDGASSVTWATQTYAQNQSANALRWGTTYNFRFDVNAAPIAGNMTLTLFKPGTPTSVAAALEVPGGAVGPVSGPFCYGDGSGTACPCGNHSASGSGEGCLNSLGFGGTLQLSGTTSVSADTALLTGSGMPDSSALFFQGTTQQNGGAGAAFGDGKRCAGGSTIRLGTKMNALGTSQYPVGGDQPISVRGACNAGDVRTYQVWYRNAAAFCTGDTFNLTAAYQIVWQS